MLDWLEMEKEMGRGRGGSWISWGDVLCVIGRCFNCAGWRIYLFVLIVLILSRAAISQAIH